ncbi:MAG: immunoglobulin-like domain-containing protein, partial [Chloroflexota bacterium]
FDFIFIEFEGIGLGTSDIEFFDPPGIPETIVTSGGSAVTGALTDESIEVALPVDSTPPEITLLGNNPLNLLLGETYTDPGATAEDDVDGTITNDIVVGGDTVDTNTLGSYTVTYDVSDAAGNAATTVTRTVNVSTAPDNTPPVITLNGDNPLELTEGDSYTDPGATAEDDVDGTITNDIVVGGDTVDTNTPGSYTVTYDVSDAAGNAATTVSRIVNVAAGPDTTPPVITLNGSDPINLTVGATFTDPGATALDDVDGDITNDITVGGDTVDVNAEGSYLITYDVSDAAGNAATTVTRTVNVSAAPDTTAPVITLNGDNPLELTEGDSYVEPGATALDDVDGNLTGSININASAVDTNTPGSYSVTYTVSDAAGNVGNATRTVTVIPVVNPGDVAMVLLPSSTTLDVGDTVDVVVQIQSGSVDFNTGEVHLEFDPSLLQVQSLTAGSSLGTELLNTFDNSAGTVGYAAGSTSGDVSGDVDLVTVTFEAIGSTSSTDIEFAPLVFPNESQVVSDGSNVLTILTETTLSIEEPPIPNLIVFPNSLSFTLEVGETESQSFTLLASDNSDPSVTYTPVDDNTSSAPTWLTVDGANSEVDVDATGLPPGTYAATVTADASGYNSVSFGVTMVVNQPTQTDDVFLNITPVQSDVVVGDEFDIVVEVASGAQFVDAVEFHLDVDPTLLEILSVDVDSTFGTQLLNSFDANSGEIDVAVGILGAANAVSGTNTVATIRLKALAETASTDIAFAPQQIPRNTDVAFNGSSVLTGLNDASVSITNLATLTGTIALQGRPYPNEPLPYQSQAVPLTVVLYEVGQSDPASSHTPTSNTEGEFEISGILPGIYNIEVKYGRHLQNVVAVNLVAGTNSKDFGLLLAGDSNDDNVVDLLDFSILSNTFNLGEGDPGYVEGADFNGDGTVTLTDFSLLSLNFNRLGDEVGN